MKVKQSDDDWHYANAYGTASDADTLTSLIVLLESGRAHAAIQMTGKRREVILAALRAYADAYRPMCGACKATGIKHVWNAQAVLVPVEPPQPCPACMATAQGFQSDTDHGG